MQNTVFEDKWPESPVVYFASDSKTNKWNLLHGNFYKLKLPNCISAFNI